MRNQEIQNLEDGEAVQINKEQKTEYLDYLWQKAGELALVRKTLQSRFDELDEEFNTRPIEVLNLHERELRRSEESEYWRINEKLQEIKGQENIVEQALVELEKGNIVSAALKRLITKPATEDVKTLSKRKQRIFEEKQRLGIDPREIFADMYQEFGPEKMHLTTGRHAYRVGNLGQMTPEEAAREFYYQTTDTHGGKTEHGKKGDVYVSKSGRRIRKS